MAIKCTVTIKTPSDAYEAWEFCGELGCPSDYSIDEWMDRSIRDRDFEHIGELIVDVMRKSGYRSAKPQAKKLLGALKKWASSKGKLQSVTVPLSARD